MKKIITFILMLSFLPIALGGCSEEKVSQTDTYDYISMDTVISIQTGELAADAAKSKEDIFKGCEDITSNIEKAISRTLEDSDLYNYNKDIDVLFDADPILTEVLSIAVDISKSTGGVYDPTIGSLTTLWNVKGGGPVPTHTAIDAAMATSGTDHIEIKDNAVYKNTPGLMLDLGGIGKGYAAQRLVEHLYNSGFSYGIVSAGRTVGVFGAKPDGSKFKIGIADPFSADEIIGYLYTDNGFISVAGDYEQYFEENGVRYHHIIDPSTGYPSDSGLTSVAVFSQNGATADALSTALMIMGYDRGMEFYKSSDLAFEAIFICNDGIVKKTDGLTDDRFEMSETYEPVITNDGTDVSTAENPTTAVSTAVSSSLSS